MMNRSDQKETLDRWLLEYRGICCKLVRIYAFGRHDQEDLYQEIAIQLWKSIPNFNARSKESTYVYQVALFAAMAWSEREAKRSEKVEGRVELDAHANFPSAEVDPRVEWLYGEISKLKLVDRSLILLLLEGYSYREIAELLGLSQSNVGSRLTRLKQKVTAANSKESVK
jgi:RNA polymerase sigma-70 factor (ECF subfamily)